LKDDYDLARLYCAVSELNRCSTLKTIESILKCKSDINAKLLNVSRELHFCCRFINSSSDIETMILLLEYNAYVNLVNKYNEAALFELVKNNNLKAIKLLLKYGAKINIKNI
jgi:ankyrin repeat protein